MSTKNPLPPNPTAPPKALIVAIKKVLRPLVRLLLSFQITLPFLVELLKEIYVDVAERDFPLNNKKQTDTRISMLTGVHRKDTRRLRNQDIERDESPTAVSIGVQLVSKWISDPNYLDADNHPKPLALKSDKGDAEPDFEHLVQSVCKQDMRARVVLDEWLRLGIASLIDEQWVKLNALGFIPSKGLEEKAYYLGMNIADHLEASTQNLIAEKPAFLERCVYYSGLSDESIEILKQDAEKQGMALLQDLNKKAIKLKTSDKKHFEKQISNSNENDTDSEPAQRMNFGLYFYSQAADQDHESI